MQCEGVNDLAGTKFPAAEWAHKAQGQTSAARGAPLYWGQRGYLLGHWAERAIS